MPKVKNHRAKVLAWSSMRGWEMVMLYDINSVLDRYHPASIEGKNLFGIVRLFIELAKEEGLTVKLVRYSETWNFKQDEAKERQAEAAAGL